mmetsp:Transcript_14749/g.41108  ORF Transcript_14749/g.41108 Transcript_14749/m.41108 type:complete len:116 (+) Transcript_14749:203-550(+)
MCRKETSSPQGSGYIFVCSVMPRVASNQIKSNQIVRNRIALFSLRPTHPRLDRSRSRSSTPDGPESFGRKIKYRVVSKVNENMMYTKIFCVNQKPKNFRFSICTLKIWLMVEFRA